MARVTEAPKPVPPKRFRRSWRRRIFFFGALPAIGMVLLLIWVVAPLAACHLARSGVAGRLNGRLSVGWASVGLREIEYRDARLSDGTGRVLATAERIVVRLDRPLWAPGKPSIESLRLIRADFVATLEPDGEWDIQRALSGPGGGDRTEARTAERIQIEDGRFELHTGLGVTLFSRVSADIGIEPSRIVLARVEGRSCDGRVSLIGHFETGTRSGWALQASASGVDVATLARGTSLDGKGLSGRLEGFLTLDRLGGRPVGAGWLDVRGGRLYSLPVFISVFNLLRGEAPGETVLDTTRCDFVVRPDRLDVERLNLLSRGPCLFGNGRILFEGRRVELNFVPRVTGEPPEGLETLEESEEPVGDFIRRNILVSVEVRGTWSEPTAEIVPLRAITRPLKDFFRLLGGEKQK